MYTREEKEIAHRASHRIDAVEDVGNHPPLRWRHDMTEGGGSDIVCDSTAIITIDPSKDQVSGHPSSPVRSKHGASGKHD